MELPEISAEIRTGLGKEKAAKLRQAGKIPAVAYGPGLTEPLHLALPRRMAKKLLTQVTPKDEVSLKVDDKRIKAFVKDVQVDVMSGELLHLDFFVGATLR